MVKRWLLSAPLLVVLMVLMVAVWWRTLLLLLDLIPFLPCSSMLSGVPVQLC